MLETINIKKIDILLIVILFSIVFNYHPSLSLAKEKESIALLEFETKGDVSKAIARGITLMLQNQLVNTGQFAVFEKGKIDDILKKDGDIIKSWEEIAKEVTERSGGNIDLLGAKRIITGDILKMGDIYFIQARMNNVGDPEVLDSKSAAIKSFNDNEIKTTAKEIIDKFTIKENEYLSEKKLSIVIYEFEAEGGSNVETSFVTDQLRL